MVQFLRYNVHYMKTLNTLDTKRIKKKPEDYAVFVVFRTAQKALEIAF